MKNDIKDAAQELKRAIRRVAPQVRREAEEIRLRLTHSERLALSRLMNFAQDSGVTITQLGEWYGSKDRKTISDLLGYMHLDPPEGAEVRVKPLHQYFEVEEVDDHRVKVTTKEPVPPEAWDKAQESVAWEGSLITDGVVTDNVNALWIELKQGTLADDLGIGEKFEGI